MEIAHPRARVVPLAAQPPGRIDARAIRKRAQEVAAPIERSLEARQRLPFEW